RRRAEGDGARLGTLARDRRGDRRHIGAGAGRRRAAALGRRRRRCRAARCASVVRARVLRPRQRVLQAVGHDLARPRHVPRLDRRARDGGGGCMNDDLMAIEASRRLTNDTVCFVGIGLPSTAANLARRTHAPGCVLIYESGTIGAKPDELPLSIGDGELAETADAVLSVPAIFSYWLQGGRVYVAIPSPRPSRRA